MDMIRPDVQEQIIRILNELETYITSANKIDLISILSIVSSFFIGFVAICISISIAKKQNKIALFEKRYNVYIEIGNIFSTIDLIEGDNSDKVFEVYFSELFDKKGIKVLQNIKENTKIYTDTKLKNYYKITTYYNYLLSSSLLFRNMKCRSEFKAIVEILVYYANLYNGNELTMKEEDVVSIQFLFIKFLDDFKKIEKQLKL